MELRVAQLIPSLTIGGAERNLVNMLNAMTCEYRAVICIGQLPSGPSLHSELDPAVELHFVRIRWRNLPIGLFRLIQLLQRHHINVVHTHLGAASLFGVLGAKLAGVPIVVTTEHGDFPSKSIFFRMLERRIISPLTDIRFCVSQNILAIRRDLYGVPASKLRLIANGTPLPPIKNKAPKNIVPNIGTVGRLVPEKDFHGLLRAVSILRDRGYDFRMHIVGEGPQGVALQKSTADLGLEGFVEFPGPVSDLDRWYRLFDLYVISSSSEGLPLTLLEAMAHGLPIVATNVGAIASVIQHEESGLIIPPGDPSSLGDAIGCLLDDETRRSELGRNARNQVEQHYTAEAVAKSHKEIYLQLLARIFGERRELN